MRQKGRLNRQQKTGVKLKGILRGNSGITLVELIVTFALISLFAVSCTQIISSAIGVYHKIRGLNYALQVSDTLMEKITGGIEGALDIPLDEESGDTTAVSITGDANFIELRDRTESHICITTTEQREKIDDYQATGGSYTKNQLLIYYYPVKGESSAEYRYKAVDWTFDEAVYMGFSVKRLSFEQPALTESADYAKNIIKVTLELYSDKYGTFRSERYVRCYNFAMEQDMEKIKSDGSSPGGGGGNPPDEPGGGTDTGPGSIEVNDTSLIFHEGKPAFEDLKKQADAMKPPNDTALIDVPSGIYHNNGKYYFVTEDTVTGKYNCNSMVGIKNYEYNWNKVMELSERLLVENDIINDQIKNVSNGSVYRYQGEYYLCVERAGGTLDADSRGKSNWVKMDSGLFTVK